MTALASAFPSLPSPAGSSALSLLLATLIVSSGSVQAGRPLQTEDAGVLEARTCELETAAARLTQRGSPAASDQYVQVACGVGGSSQVALAASRAVIGGGPSDAGLRLGGKTEVWSIGKDAGAVTVAWGLSSLKPAGLAWKSDVADARLVLSVPLGPVTWHTNLGHERDVQARSSTTVWGLAAEHPGVGDWAPMAEIYGDDRGSSAWNLGLRYTVQADKAFVDASWGRGWTGGRPRLWTVGFKFLF